MIPLPYVYKCVNKNTGEFYFGYRSRNKVPAEQDLGVTYFSSSKLVRPIFDQFDYEVLQCYPSKIEAHQAEQALIEQHWSNPLLLNRALFPKIRNTGQSDKQKAKARERMLTANPMKLQHNIEAARQRATGKKASEQTKAKMSAYRKGKKYPNKKKVDQRGSLNPSAKHYIFRSPDGSIHNVCGKLLAFSKEQQLGYNSILDVVKGRRSNWKGWTVTFYQTASTEPFSIPVLSYLQNGTG